MRTIFGYAMMAVMAVACINQASAEETPVPLDKLPQAVTDAIKKMFPKAELIKATQEEEDGETEYEVTIKDNGKMIAVKLESDGDIEELEKEIDLKDLPKAVTEALDQKYPKSVRQSAEAVYEIEGGKEKFEYYEIQLKTADNKEIEVKIKKDGKIVSDSDGEKDKPEPPK